MSLSRPAPTPPLLPRPPLPAFLSQERQQQYLEVETSEVARLAQATHFTHADLDELRAIIRTTAQKVSPSVPPLFQLTSHPHPPPFGQTMRSKNGVERGVNCCAPPSPRTSVQSSSPTPAPLPHPSLIAPHPPHPHTPAPAAAAADRS